MRSKTFEGAVRAQLASVLDWGDAHATLDASVKGIAPRLRGVRPKGLPHSAWELVEHIRLAQADILEFCRSAGYKEKKWPEGYWPASPKPSGAAWARSLAAFRRDRRAFQRLTLNRRVALTAKIPHGTGQTYLREILLVADHTAHHVAQIIDVRRALGIWR